MVDGGQLFVLCCIDNEALLRWYLFDFIIVIFLVDDEVNIWLNFPNFINEIVDGVYLFVDSHFSELAFGVVSEVKV